MTEKRTKGTWKEHKRIDFFSVFDKILFQTKQRDFFFVMHIHQRGVLGTYLKLKNRHVVGVCTDSGVIFVVPDSDLDKTAKIIAHEYLHKVMQCKPYVDGYYYDEHVMTEKMGFGGKYL
jgi:hypothetical protein